ncbi:DUF6438 domain-containing protein [Olleya marilimosa]|uniref:DUF6438 domain-containing protein n=1 Tax=Olleya marilimosa TaxID=272164 RepID=UPI00168D0C0A|nr:DUF6438 domain-containing protein [Olleya marilimosa]MBD3892218.1 hypothetical protein [Olleya marilimosa]
MLKKTVFILTILSLLVSCKKRIESDKLIGEWGKRIVSDKKIIELVSNNFDTIPDTEIPEMIIPSPTGFYRPYGFSFSLDKFELFNGFDKVMRDSISNKRKNYYLGNFTDYELRNDSIFIIEPFEKEWSFMWKIKELDDDKLVVIQNDSVIKKYFRLKNNNSLDFDQIIYSSSGCYGTCPIIDVSVDKNGNMIFQGEKYVNQIGFFKKKLSPETVQYIFDKFSKIKIDELSDNYDVGHTDDQVISTTLIKNGKIVKTIHDYGKIAPRELFWAYNRISNLHNLILFDSIKNERPYYPKLHYYTFRKDKLILPLEKSESFYFWNELLKSKKTSKEHKELYIITLRGNFVYFSNDLNENTKPQYIVKKITTDGQLYTFIYEDGIKRTYDLGYNFIERNFNENNFRKPKKWE